MDYTLYQGDCLEVMKKIPDKSVDMILCDLPYGITRCGWDGAIPFEPLWECYERLIKDKSAIVLFGAEPFSSALRTSKMAWYKYDWVWEKVRPSGFQTAKYKPMQLHENIMVFTNGGGAHNYYPIMEPRAYPVKGKVYGLSGSSPITSTDGKYRIYSEKYPQSILRYMKDLPSIHPTQKPVALLEYLIKTYTKDGELVLDNTMGSGSTGVACLKTGRKFIGIELEEKYFNMAKERIEAQAQLERSRLF